MYKNSLIRTVSLKFDIHSLNIKKILNEDFLIRKKGIRKNVSQTIMLDFRGDDKGMIDF